MEVSKASEFLISDRVIKIADRVIAVGGPIPKLKGGEKLVRYTNSICPYCNALLPAVIVERDGKWFIRKICPEHGEIEDVYQGDAEYAKRLEKFFIEGRGPRHAYTDLTAPCPYSCGLCPIHMSHTAIANLVATNRCDLDCWFCFFYAEKSGFVYEPDLSQIKYMVEQLLKQKVTPVIQVTGGEPTVREDLPEIISLLKSMGVKHIQLNTHAITFARLYVDKGLEAAASYARDLRTRGVNTVYMSFDGVSPRANPKNHWEAPYALEAFRAGGMTSVVLVPVIIKNVNTEELGDIVRFAALNQDVVRGVNFQPVSLTGMIRRAEREKLRITISDAVKLIEEQTRGQIKKEDWFPVPASVPISEFIERLAGEFKFEMANHPHCGVATYVYTRVLDRGSAEVEFIPITRFIDVYGLLDYLVEKSEELRKGGFKSFVGLKLVANLVSKYVRWGDVPRELRSVLPKMLANIFIKRSYEALGEWHYKMLFLGMMHFMDLYNYDVERVMRCNVHYLMPDGRVIPFCTFNVMSDVYRDYVQKKYVLPLEEWKFKMGSSSLESIKYRRSAELIKKLTTGEPYIRTYRPWLHRWVDLYPWIKEYSSS
ncbi:MAG: radical SAM protein [Sulfolobales archaeon]